MKIPSYVRPCPFWLTFYNRFSKAKGQVAFNKIYLRKDIYEDLLREKPNPQSVGYLLHEEEHIKRMKKVGWFTWNFKYSFSPSFRFREELAADKARFAYLKKHRVKFDFEKRARGLSGWAYLWCTSYKEAKEELEKIWEGE